MEDLQRLYPIGIQTFFKIREGNFLYIDKTEYVYRMTHSASSYLFLSRPRRFGKSFAYQYPSLLFRGTEGFVLRDWPWRHWRRNGYNTRCCTST